MEISSAHAASYSPPPAQSSALLMKTVPLVAAEIGRHKSWPCLAVAACFPRQTVSWQGIQAPDDEILAWIGHDTGKRPDLHPDCTILMLHASTGFSSDHAIASDEEIIASLLKRASEMTSCDWTSPLMTFVQRWRHALPDLGTRPSGIALYSTPAPLVVAGDWCVGGRIEGAWLAGLEAAEQLR